MSIVAEVIENWDKLTFEDKELSLDLMQRGINEQKRENLIARIEDAKLYLEKRKVRIGMHGYDQKMFNKLIKAPK